MIIQRVAKVYCIHAALTPELAPVCTLLFLEKVLYDGFAHQILQIKSQIVSFG